MRNANDKRYTSNKKAASSSRDTIAAGRHSGSIRNKMGKLHVSVYYTSWRRKIKNGYLSNSLLMGGQSSGDSVPKTIKMPFLNEIKNVFVDPRNVFANK